MNVFRELNKHPLNRQAEQILSQNNLQFSPGEELAAIALINHAMSRDLLEIRGIDEPELLLAKLHANPILTMELMTQSGSEESFQLDLTESETIEEAAAQILEEIIATIRAQ